MTMMKRFLPLVVSLLGSLPLFAQVALEECVTLAQENYPLIRKYGLLAQVEEIDLSEINKSWLPQVSLYGQGTAQNETPSLPESLARVIDQAGMDMKGVDEWQYKAGVDIRQNVWDGGESKAQKNTARAERAERQAALDVQLYAVRERVEDLFFAILLLDEQMAQTRNMLTLLENNLDKLRAMLRHGTAMQSDVDMVEAQCLSVKQQLIQAERS